MALFRKFFYRKPPDGLLEISERVYVFDYCFTTDVLEEDEYKVYIGGIVAHLREHFPDASFMVFNFREGEHQSQIASILSEFDTTVMDYPRHYEGCPLLTMEMVHHFLRSSESWLSLGQNNVLLMHCERGGWPVLAFMLAGLMIYRKQYTGEQKTLDMIYKQAPRELLQLLSPLNPLPSQLRYLQYISRRNVGSEWPPLDRALTLDCVILRVLPNFDRESGCRPIFRIYGQDPFIATDRTPKVLFSTPKKSRAVRLYKADCELVKIDIHCHIQGDVVLECISLDDDVEREEMMFRVMFNTAFIRSNILILNRDEIDILWDAKDRFPKDFRAEILLSEMDAASSIITMELTSGDEKEGLPVEAFAKVQEIFSNVDWLDPSGDAALHVLQHIASSNALQLDGLSPVELEGDAMSQKSSPGVLKEILQSQEANDGREDVAFRVLQHIASSKALQEKLDALSPKEFESDDMSQKSSPSMLKEMLRSQEANDGRGDVALRVLQHIASSKTLQEKLDAWSLKEVETDAISQKSQETNARWVDAAFPGLENMASLNALQEKHDPSSKKEVESDYISEKSSPSVLKEMFQSQETNAGRTAAALDVLQHFETPNALQDKIDASSLKKMESDALSRKLNPLPNEMLQSHESFTSIEKSSPPANPSDWKAASENIELRDAAAAGHRSQPEFLIQHTESGSDPASSNNPPQSLESNDGIKNSSTTTPKQQSIPFNEYSPESNAKSQNIKVHSVGAALHPSQPRILTQRMPKSRSNPTSLNNSLQGPPVPISRYHSAPSALGITALLHDHAAFGSSEVTHSVAIPPLSLSLSSASVYGLCEPTRIKTASPTPVPSSLTISTDISTIPSLSIAVTDNSATTATISPPPPPPPPPLPSSASPRTTFSIPPPPPPPFLCPPRIITTTAASTMRMVTPSPPSPRPLLLSPPPPPLLPPKSEPTVMLPSLAQKAAPPTPSTSASVMAWAPEQLSKPLINLPASKPVNTTPSPCSPHYGTSSVKGLPNSVPCPPPPPSSLGMTFVGSPRCESNIPSMPLGPPPPPPPPPRVDPLTSYHPPSPASVAPPPPPPPPRVTPSSPNPPSSPMKIAVAAVSAPPPPPPPSLPIVTSSQVTPSAPPPPPPPNITSSTNATSPKPSNAPPIPPPPASLGHGALNGLNGLSSQSTSSASNAPPPPANGMPGSSLGMKGRSSIRPNSRNTTKRSNLKPLHWVKVTRAMSGSLWAEAQKTDEASKAPEFDMSELESLFSTAMPNSDARGSTNRSSGRSSLGQKSEKVQLIDLRRANNCEIMLTKVKMPLPDLMSSLLALDDSVLDIDQIDNLIKFCPTKEEMDLLKAFSGDKESLGKCEQYFLELMKVPRVESKLRVFSFKIQFRSQVADLSNNLNTVNSAAGEIRNSAKLKRIMQTILSLGNALNQGTARGSAVGFRLDSLLKLTDTRARNNKMTLMHYLCKVLAEKLPELLDFSKDLVSLEVASKIQLKTLAEEMQSISKGLEKVEQELTASENDGPVSETFHKTLKEFLVGAEAEVRALTSLYSNVGRNADALALYFGEDPARCPFEQVVSTLLNFVKMFARAHEENCKQLELDKKKAQKEAESEKTKLGTPKREFESLSRSSSKKNESLSRSVSNKNANIK